MLTTIDKFYFEHPIIVILAVILCLVVLFLAAGRLEYVDDGSRACENCQQVVYKNEMVNYNGELVCSECYTKLHVSPR